MTVTEQIFTKLTLDEQIFVKSSHAEFYENPAGRFSRWYYVTDG
jgi:hypothetical protein